ncbi:uncharacterized protein LOC118408289 isoform X2 [Branchiostoma floridae]|uniref:Uncharacterized protein LOC118408289 isoform X2 n=1 Tax=Branchiostoma floridae TaxID=7739 RepID=A0A9J7KL08_BRAFL|nr:uncharacterized protein LOC118408289 isoform X2 [Branchiostoma floridae]
MGAHKYTTHQVGLLDMGHQQWMYDSLLNQEALKKARKHEIAIRLPKISSSDDSEYITPVPATSAPCNTPEVCYLPPVPGALPATCRCSEGRDFKFKFKRYNDNDRHDSWRNNTVVSRVDIGKYLPKNSSQTSELHNDNDSTARYCRKKRQNYRKFGIRNSERDRTELPYLDVQQGPRKCEDMQRHHQSKHDGKKEAKCAKVMIVIPCGTANDQDEDLTKDRSFSDVNTPEKVNQGMKTSKMTKLPPIKTSSRQKMLMELPRIPVGEEDLTQSMARQSAVPCLKEETHLELSGSHTIQTHDRPSLSLPNIPFVHTQNLLFTYPS